MVSPLQEQLLKAGLVNSNQVKKAAKEKYQASQQPGNADPTAEQIRQAQQQKAESDRQRNLEQQQAREQKALAAQIRQLIETQRIDRSGGTVSHQFVDHGKIKKIVLHAQQREQLIRGTLAVVRLDERHELVPVGTAQKIAQRDPGVVVVLNAPPSSAAEDANETDPYADHPIPDDLMW
ncbi:MAG: DUF2058 domain-containing protein [Pseudomonadales bacterium]|jgi:uncharacterized protein YaiL (DUF2058 family)|nr:DUF2058 domain-containing protein [Pseudomonadales bacterium]MCC6529831.1 DUF2058 domain-containing protein [Pseudomonadales bacterium]MCP5332496.1 DUF2058 domain-containing protein [Pseudomonadales bacterium]HMU89639.1 DUF2058 domain-containing protein [Pseudomonadales bacterium]HMW15867.1 DUF2058 domain-containing protein [Pseudomonadales bacterium]